MEATEAMAMDVMAAMELVEVMEATEPEEVVWATEAVEVVAPLQPAEVPTEPAEVLEPELVAVLQVMEVIEKSGHGICGSYRGYGGVVGFA